MVTSMPWPSHLGRHGDMVIGGGNSNIWLTCSSRTLGFHDPI